MTKALNFRTLNKDDLGQMHRSFIEAFSSYQVSMKMSREAFEDRMLSKLNINFDVSPGVFSGDKLVGFIFQTINQYEGELSAYNGGTGVIPGYLGQGLTSRLYNFIQPKLAEEGVQKCVLEVLENNESAIKAYSKNGFQIVKTFQCLMLKDGILRRDSGQMHHVEKAGALSLDLYRPLCDIEASMLDQLSQVQYHLSKETILEYRKNNELLGFMIFQIGNGRISQIAVGKNHRRKGVGTALVARAHVLSESKTLSILNIETKHEGVIHFFIKLGFIRDLQQYEMQKQLIDV